MILGVGVNDANYKTQPVVDGKKVTCPIYIMWKNLLTRCYSNKSLNKCPTYKDCYVCEDWLYFSKFKAWIEGQDWRGKELDKDILSKGNKIYSPEFCVYVSHMTNCFVVEGSQRMAGNWPIGVTYCNKKSSFQAQCNNPFTKKGRHIGYFETPEKAHLAWKKRKHELALQLAELQTDDRVAAALRVRYL